MNLSRSESDYKAKQDGANDETKIVIKPNLTTSSWSRLKDPRIVRVSRAFGGKDRHSKVCTVRGLRDRRVRLSVQTAIQLYDLQDRLGLNQPSKVVDWLLEAAKNEINELPPLQIPPGIFEQNLQGMMNVSSQEGVKSNTNVGGLNWEDYWNTDRSKVVARESNDADARNKQNEDQDHDGNFLDRNPNSANFPGLFNNVVGNSSFLKWDPSNLSLSQFGSYGSANHPHQHDASNSNSIPIPSGSSQVLMYHQPPVQTQPYFPNSAEFDQKQQQMDFQMVSSSASSSSNFATPLFTVNQGMRPFHLSMNPKFFSSEDNGGHEPNK